MPTINQFPSCIQPLAIEANNFEIKQSLLNWLQNAGLFNGLPSKDPYTHVNKFLRVCKTYKENGVPEDTIQLMLFEYVTPS